MVNIAKRMRGLKPKLLTIRNGPGAAILPPPPAPQLVHVHLKSPPVSNGRGYGARMFWRQHLKRLKFYNPALPITVEYATPLAKGVKTLSLRFEHKDPEVLRQIPGNTRGDVQKPAAPKKVHHMTSEDEKELLAQQKELLARQQDPNFRNAPISWKRKDEEAEALEQAAIDAELSAEAITQENAMEPDMEASVDQVPGNKATNIDAEASAADIPEGKTIDINAYSSFNDEVVPSATNVKGGATLYTRSVTLGIGNRSVDQIWAWFSRRTQCTDVEMSAADSKEQAELDLFFEQSAIDRKKVKEGREAVKKEQADLQRARGEADRLKQELM